MDHPVAHDADPGAVERGPEHVGDGEGLGQQLVGADVKNGGPLTLERSFNHPLNAPRDARSAGRTGNRLRHRPGI